MEYIGIDIGSTAAKVYTVHDGKPLCFATPTGWSSKHTSRLVSQKLLDEGIDVNDKERFYTVSTGYGRQVVDYADETVTEITCHGRGGSFLAAYAGGEEPLRLPSNAEEAKKAGVDCTIVDVGGQDTKIIVVENHTVIDFLMNDKCAAGTGKFIELMANRLAVDIPELYEMAESGKVIPISALCTVFAESEVVSLIGQNKDRTDIAAGVIDSVATKVASLCQKRRIGEKVILTGGLSQTPYFAKALGRKIGRNVLLHPLSLYAGAIGAMLSAMRNS